MTIPGAPPGSEVLQTGPGVSSATYLNGLMGALSPPQPPVQQPEFQSNKNQPNGYAGLDASGQIPAIDGGFA